jgi:deazaflavin-dependent oxidoreductase (nitroreductase family)
MYKMIMYKTTTTKRFSASKQILRTLFYIPLICLLLITAFTIIFKKIKRVRDTIRRASKHLLNPLTLPMVGRGLDMYAVIQHRGRRSGRLYTTPVLVEPITSGFVIPLTYGTEADWYKNILAAGSCTIIWGGDKYAVGEPEIIDRATALALFSLPVRLGLRIFRIARFLKLRYYGEVEQRSATNSYDAF